MKLLIDAGNGNGSWFVLREGRNREKSNLYTIHIYGTFNGATVTAEISADPPDHSNTPTPPTNIVPIPAFSAIAAGAYNIEARTNWIRLVVAGGAAPVINAVAL